MDSFERSWEWENNLRVALVHSFYSSRNPSGENAVVNQQADALRRAGYAVEVFAQRTDERELSKLYPLEAAATVATGRGPKPRLEDFKPDIIHVHNLFPNYGKQWIKAAPAPVVTTLHNYRPLCAVGTFFRDGKVCTDCADQRSSRPAVQHGCYRGRAQTVPVAIGQRFDQDPMLSDASTVIALSEQMSAIYEKAGVPGEKIEVLPHFLPTDLDAGAGPGGDYWLYAGRLSPEKGILPLLDEWPEDRELVVVGQGELDAEVAAAAAGRSIRIVKQVERHELMGMMRGARGLVFPSRWFEGFGLVYMEALAAGTPVLAWEPSVVSSMIESDGTGIVVRGSLTDALLAADASFPDLREHCHSVFEAKYTETQWVPALRNIYTAAMS